MTRAMASSGESSVRTAAARRSTSRSGAYGPASP